MRKFMTIVAAAGLAVAGLALSAPAASAASTASVSVVHGIPGTPVNVFVNGKSTIPDFQPGTVAGPLELPAGDYEIKIYPAADKEGTGDPVITASATLSAGQNVSLVAHLTADGKPTLTPFVNDTAQIAAGKAGLVVRHTAAAPAVDVRANGQVAFKDLTNPNQAAATLPAGSIEADVVLAGTTTVVIGPATLDLKAGTQTIVYAIGSAEAKTLGVVVQTITGLGSAPGGVPAGTGGFAGGSTSGTPGWMWLLLAVGGLLVVSGGAAGSVRLARARH